MSKPMVPRPAVDPRIVPDVPHGGMAPGSARTPGGARWVDLSLSTNPYGPPPFLAEAWTRARSEVAAYPDRTQSVLSERIAEAEGVDASHALVAGSASELIRCLIAAFGPRRDVIVPQYTYEEYRRVAISVGGRVRPVGMPGVWLSPEEMADRVTPGALVVLANPGTPNGQFLSPRGLSPLVERVTRQRALLAVDESYRPFLDGPARGLDAGPNVVTLFSWSKVLGTPGIPLGHAVGSPEVLAALRSQLLPWSVGPVARHLVLLALEAPGWQSRTLARVRHTAQLVRRRLRSRSRTNYFPVSVGSAAGAAAFLWARGFRVRELTSMGLPGHIRFAVRRPAETQRFLGVLDAYLGRCRRAGAHA